MHNGIIGVKFKNYIKGIIMIMCYMYCGEAKQRI